MRMSRLRLRLAIGTCLVALFSGSGVSLAAASSGLPGDVHTLAAAQAKAQLMLPLLALPPGSAITAASTSPLLQYANAYPATTPDFVGQATQWWTVPGTDAQLTAYLKTLDVPGFSLGFSYEGNAQSAALAAFQQPGLAVNADATLSVEHVQLGAQVVARVDAMVVWLPLKSALEVVPRTVKSAVLDYSDVPPTPPPFGGGDTTPRPRHAHKVVTGAALRRIIAAIDDAHPAVPFESSCPQGIDETATLAFHYSGHKVTATIGRDTCGNIDITVDGQRQWRLEYGYPLVLAVYAALGIELTPIPHVPPQGPSVTTAAPQLTVLEHNVVEAERVGDRALETYGLYAPEDAAGTGTTKGPLRPAYTGPGHFVDRTGFLTVKGKRADLVAWFRAYAPKGYVAAQPASSPTGVRLVLEPKDPSLAVSAVVWITMAQRGGHVDFRIDAYTAWLPRG
jgi:hypothetical protein